jgi:DNA-binding NtrC family response regulator
MAPRHDDIPHAPSAEDRRLENWLEDAMARDPVLSRMLPDLRRLAGSEAPVLISGEPGSGRELAARAIHNLSPRAAQPFVVIDCAALSEPLMEAEMLGIDGGSQSGGPHKMGIFEQAGAGTVLLAEVGELPLRVQEALVRLLDRHEVVRLNSEEPIPARARCLASTSVDLRGRIGAGLFREDLHARLAGELLALPPLRERPEDIPALARHFLAQCCAHLGPAACDLGPEVEAALRAYPWPGNLRELREVVEEAALRARGERITLEHLPDRLRGATPGGPLPSLRDVEMRHIERVLQEARGNQRRASRILGISRWSLSRRLRKYGMQARAEE